MRILIAGVGGQVGAALVRALQSGATIIPTDRSILDLSKPAEIAAVLDRLHPDLVINAAAYTAVDKAETEPELARRVNAESPGVMALWSAKADVPLIHFSTEYVFDGAGSRPWSEGDLPHALSVYGSTKLAGEGSVRAARGSSLIVRTSWVYSASGTNFLRSIARAATTRRELRVVSDQVGAPTSAAALADIIATMLAGGLTAFRDRVNDADGLVHVTASGEASWHEFASEIVTGLKARGRNLEVEDIVAIGTDAWPTPARRPLNSRLNLERLRSVFGITPPDWRVALAPELDRLMNEPL